jgi:hypothetical protein
MRIRVVDELPSVRRHAITGAAIAVLSLLVACGPHWPLKPPAGAAGQIADAYRSEAARALVLAQIDVVTDGESGFGPIGNPMLLQFDAGEGVARDEVRDLTIPDLNPLSILDPNAPCFTSDSYQPRLWRYAKPGLLAVSLRPGAYDAMIVFYPDTARIDRPVDSIPAPNRPLLFAPLRVDAGTITYIGDIQIAQTIGWSDFALDRVGMDYAVVDRYDQTVAGFRARYPQFQSAEIEKRLIVPVTEGD